MREGAAEEGQASPKGVGECNAHSNVQLLLSHELDDALAQDPHHARQPQVLDRWEHGPRSSEVEGTRETKEDLREVRHRATFARSQEERSARLRSTVWL